MAHTLVPSGDVSFIREAEIGSIYVYVTINWGVKIGLTGVPAISLRDGLGNNHAPEKAQPHISDPTKWSEEVTWRFQSVPAFDAYEVSVPLGIAGIVDGSGNTTAAGTYTAVPASE